MPLGSPADFPIENGYIHKRELKRLGVRLLLAPGAWYLPGYLPGYIPGPVVVDLLARLWFSVLDVCHGNDMGTGVGGS